MAIDALNPALSLAAVGAVSDPRLTGASRVAAASGLAGTSAGGTGGRGGPLVVRAVSGPPSIAGGRSVDGATTSTRQTSQAAPGRTAQPARNGTAYQTNTDGDSATFSSKLDQLSKEEKKQVEELTSRDREVRTHEEAHRAAAGALFRGGPHYDYQTGPDGRRYAVGGRVQIDTSPGKTPEETIKKAQQVQRSALAPAEPSSTDRSVAAKAAKMEADARAEMARAQRGGNQGDQSSGQANGPTDPQTSGIPNGTKTDDAAGVLSIAASAAAGASASASTPNAINNTNAKAASAYTFTGGTLGTQSSTTTRGRLDLVA